MKKSIFLIAFLLLGIGLGKADAAVKDGKDSLIRALQEAESKLFKDVKGLSDEQLNFKPDTASWSVAQCMIHIARTEGMLLSMVQGLVKQPSNPDKRDSLKGADGDVLKMMEDRSQKFKAPEPLQPKLQDYQLGKVLDSLKEQRAHTLAFIEQVSLDDLRNHLTLTPAQEYADAYRMVLYIAGHSLRHTAQIEEVKSSSNFPKK